MLDERTGDKVVVPPPTGRPYPVITSSRRQLAETMRAHGLAAGRCLVVTDDNVAELYGAEIETELSDGGFDVSMQIVQPGEAAKDLEIVSDLYRWAFAEGVDRSTPVVALGGGVVGDLTGFFAATVLRGVPLIHVPTTLVAQVDSSIGGKTGVNHVSGKNLIGSFYRPTFTLADTELLGTLPDVEWRNGLSEVLKHALIRDAEFYGWLRENWQAIVNRNTELVPDLVRRAMHIKIDVVAQDELEHGLRRILNFGHTFGHAIERIAGFGTIGHGSAVALGMRAATWLSKDRGRDVPLDEIDTMLRDLKPAHLPRLPVDWLLQSMRRDKKRIGDTLHLILLESVGRADIVTDATDVELRSALDFALS